MATNPAVERRIVTSRISLRAVSGKSYAEGYASVFNRYSQDLGGFREMVVPGAFSRAIRERQDVRCLLNHDANFVLGRTRSGTLALEQDSTGLHFRCNLPATQAGRDLQESMERGDIDQCSFGFSVVQPGGDDWSEDERDGVRFVARRVRDLNLYDVSCVTYPAYTDTSCQVSERALVEARNLAHSVSRVDVPSRRAELLTVDQREDCARRARAVQTSRIIAADDARAYLEQVERWRTKGC